MFLFSGKPETLTLTPIMFIIPLKKILKKKEKNLLESKETIKWIEEINKIHGINIASLEI